MLAVNGHAKHRQSLCRVGYGKTALSMDLFFITTENILSTHTFLLLNRYLYMEEMLRVAQHDRQDHYSAYVTLTVIFLPGALMPQLYGAKAVFRPKHYVLIYIIYVNGNIFSHLSF